jgi:hypothetical protein
VTLIRQNEWNFGGLVAVLFLIVPAAKPSLLKITFPSGANVGDGGTISTDGCSICSDGDITGFDFTLLGFEFMPPSSSTRVSGSPGSLLGNDFVDFSGPTNSFPALSLFETGTFNYVVDIAHVETPAQGQFLLVPSAVPEPSSLALILAALLPLGFAGRFRNNRRKWQRPVEATLSSFNHDSHEPLSCRPQRQLLRRHFAPGHFR